MAKNVLLIGATGFVGSAILNELISRGHKVTAIVRDANSLAGKEGDENQGFARFAISRKNYPIEKICGEFPRPFSHN